MVYLALIPLLPLLGFLIIGIGFKILSRPLVSVIACGSVIASFILCLLALSSLVSGHSPLTLDLFTWIVSSSGLVSLTLKIDQLSALMTLVVTGVGFLIHVYSIGYMGKDPGYNRFFAYMNLFIFFMLILVLSTNFVLMFVGWEGVGLCSYLLIGFWFKNKEFNQAANKAFIMNRIGDLGFLLGMFLIHIQFHSFDFNVIFSNIDLSTAGNHTLTAITLLLFFGAVGKSAQIPLYTWLPDAMAGPTPVSALIHAATMVTAGIYMVARLYAMFVLAPISLEVIGIIGIATAILAATIAIYQNDIKKILAYSTISQLGYMFLGLSVGAPAAAVFHLTTHAFFKALLFLAAGSIIHSLGGQQDIRRMGGLKKSMPITWFVFLAGALAISGIFPFSGFFSKDEILMHVFLKNQMLWVLAVLGSMLTAFYIFRLVFLVFFGGFRGSDEESMHVHESPAVMYIPLVALAILSISGGLLNIPAFFGGSDKLGTFLAPVFSPHSLIVSNVSNAPSLPIILILITLSGALLAIGLAWIRYVQKGKVPGKDGEKLPFLQNLLTHKYYVDEIYKTLIDKPLFYISELLRKGETGIIDNTVNGIGTLSLWLSGILRQLQTGAIGYYMIVMVLSLVIFIAYTMMF